MVNWNGINRQNLAIRCGVCGDKIPCPVPRPDGSISCQSCWRPFAGRGLALHDDLVGRADRQYHGGQFYNGEW